MDSALYGINFTHPQYGGNFYPGEDASRLAGTIRVNSGEEKIVLQVADREYTLPVLEGKATFSVDVSDLTETR